MSTVKFSVSAKSENSTKTVVTARDFKMIIDEPANLGGTDEGANPAEFILAALSGCINVVGHLVAKEMGFQLNGMEVDVEGDLDPGKFSGQSTQGRAGYIEIRATVKPDTNADKETLDKWLKAIEDRCPMSDNISNPTPVRLSIG
ncbi:MAG: osmotically inducible protein C [Clostridiales bacterium]|nr:MAG: osmotically inducible protein C [Clostridiales bacterium]